MVCWMRLTLGSAARRSTKLTFQCNEMVYTMIGALVRYKPTETSGLTLRPAEPADIQAAYDQLYKASVQTAVRAVGRPSQSLTIKYLINECGWLEGKNTRPAALVVCGSSPPRSKKRRTYKSAGPVPSSALPPAPWDLGGLEDIDPEDILDLDCSPTELPPLSPKPINRSSTWPCGSPPRGSRTRSVPPCASAVRQDVERRGARDF